VQCKTFKQGEKIFIDCHNLDESQRYVAFSRVAEFSQLTITNFCKTKVSNEVQIREKFWERLPLMRITTAREGLSIWNLTDQDSFARIGTCRPKRCLTIGKEIDMFDSRSHVWENIRFQFPNDINFTTIGQGRGKLSSSSFSIAILLQQTRSPLLLQSFDAVLIINKLKKPRLQIHLHSNHGHASRLFFWDPNIYIFNVS
jgi:hypothetical protein